MDACPLVVGEGVSLSVIHREAKAGSDKLSEPASFAVVMLPLRCGLRLMLLEEARQGDEVLDTQLLGTLGEDLCGVARVVSSEERLEGVA